MISEILLNINLNCPGIWFRALENVYCCFFQNFAGVSLQKPRLTFLNKKMNNTTRESHTLRIMDRICTRLFSQLKMSFSTSNNQKYSYAKHLACFLKTILLELRQVMDILYFQANRHIDFALLQLWQIYHLFCYLPSSNVVKISKIVAKGYQKQTTTLIWGRGLEKWGKRMKLVQITIKQGLN